MLQNIFSSIIGIGIVAAGIFGFGHGSTSPNFSDDHEGTSTHLMASTTVHDDFDKKGSISSTTITCISSAVALRESSLDSAVSTYTASLNAAYTARANALASAYTASSTSAIRSGIKSAWSAFASTTKSAAKTWRAAQQSAWKVFRSSVQGCSAPGSITDSSQQGQDISGQ